MRNLFLFLFLLLAGTQAQAQELRQLRVTGTAKKLDNEMIARRDINGEYAAAIQIITNLEGLSYDSWDGVVDEVERKPGQDMVFVTHRERVLEIYALGYQKLQIILSENGIHLKPREVWQITISGDAPPAATLPVTIRITPADAALTIDGKPASGTTHSLTPGSHTLKIEKEGFKTEEKTITVSEKQVFFEFALQRQPDAGLQIETTPGGASVYLDGVKLGETPLAVFYKPGTYPVRIVKEGYVTLENQTLEVALPQTRKSYTLEENVGYLTINTHSGASVYFNDQLIANPKNVKLPPQLVKVKVTMPKAEPLEQQVVLKRNDRLTFDLYPQVQTGTIQIAVTPFNAQIELTGDAGEKYNATGMKVFEDIPVGSYTIKIHNFGYKTQNEIIKIEANKPNVKNYSLERGNFFVDGIEMVYVKGEAMTIGCTPDQGEDCDREAITVTLGDFYISKYEITQKQWRSIMGDDPSELVFKGCDDCPVERVSWSDAREFVSKLSKISGKNYRLPTHNEWEYAARGGVKSKGFKYSGSNNIDQVAWYWANSGDQLLNGNFDLERMKNNNSRTKQVGQKQSNELGIFDMSGNVWEWCGNTFSLENNNAIGKGGGWNNIPEYCKVANYSRADIELRHMSVGFRIAISLDTIMEMVFVKGGTYTMGCSKEQEEYCFDDEKPPHQVTINDFYIGIYEVTVTQFKQFIDETSSRTIAELYTGGSYVHSDDDAIFKKGVSWMCDEKGNLRPESEYDHPVIHISYLDAEYFCEWLSDKTGKRFRLPTEAEWEYAARGGEKGYQTKYSGSNIIDEVAWCLENSQLKINQIGRKKPNELGIYDMSGNVWEWCSDWYDADYYLISPHINPLGPTSQMSNVIRGGSFGDPFWACRVAQRKHAVPLGQYFGIGFRVVYSAD